jgi:hypothetical protein
VRYLTAEQVLGLFSLAERHQLLRHGNTVQVFRALLTEPRCQALALLGIPPSAYKAAPQLRLNFPTCRTIEIKVSCNRCDAVNWIQHADAQLRHQDPDLASAI